MFKKTSFYLIFFFYLCYANHEVFIMNNYQLQALLRDGKIVNISLPNCSTLLDIDRFTNQYDRFNFEIWLEKEGYLKPLEHVQSFQIAIKGKNYPYSAMFENPYLKKIFTHMTASQQIDTTCPDFQEMKKYLFQQLEEDKFQFLEKYPYQNHLSRKINRYLQSGTESLEDLFAKKQIETEIIHELSRYKTYRSLSLYRKNQSHQYFSQINRKTNPSATPAPNPAKVKNVAINMTFEEFEKKIQLQPSYTEIQVYVNDFGEEKEEFLTEEEMTKGQMYR